MFGDLASLDSKLLVKNGTVVFLAYDSKTTRPSQGLFSVPADGGAVRRIANYNTDSPNGWLCTQFDESFRQPFGGLNRQRQSRFCGDERGGKFGNFQRQFAMVAA
jgi:hypothetical protein